MNRSQNLLQNIHSVFEEATSPDPREPRDDMLQQLSAMRATMDSGKLAEMDQFINWFGAERYGLWGDADQILQRMHPWQLQIVVQRFKVPAVGLNSSTTIS